MHLGLLRSRNTLLRFCQISETLKGGVPIENLMKIPSIQKSFFWKRMLLDEYFKAEDLVDTISGTIAVMLADTQKAIKPIKEKLKTENYNDIVATFMYLKEEYIELVELEQETWSFKQPKKKSTRKSQDFGWLSMVDMLAGGDMLKYDDIEAQEYNLVFAKVAMAADQSWS